MEDLAAQEPQPDKSDVPEEPKDTNGSTTKEESASTEDKLGDTVAKHYNQLQESGLEARVQSRIFYMRNLNNWIKSVLISEFLQRIRKQNSGDYRICVLDLCSGKGGDLQKWKKGFINQLICVDIAETSVEQCEVRYKEQIDRNSKERNPREIYSAEFITADCTQVRLKDRLKDLSTRVNLTSCQFSFHYSFESYAQADRMLQNACEILKPGGYFIGTTPNANELVKRWRASEDNSFGNEVYRVTFDSDNKDDIPLFGAKYMFHLEGVVDCPEFLVHFPTFIKLAQKHGMQLVYKKTFGEYVMESSKLGDSRALLGRMQALEPYPADEDIKLLSKEADAYDTAKEVYTKLREEAVARGDHEGKLRKLKVGTLSKDEWDAATLYVVFAFQKEGGETSQSENTEEGSRKRSHDDSAENVTESESHENKEGVQEKMQKVE